MATKDVVVPLRFLSDDGICAFEVSLRLGSKGDVSNGVGIANAAKRVLNDCPVRDRTGGRNTGFSRLCAFVFPLLVIGWIVVVFSKEPAKTVTAVYGDLQVSVMRYQPNVTCHQHVEHQHMGVPSLASCRKLYQRFPRGRNIQNFTGAEKSHRNAVKLPRLYSEGRKRHSFVMMYLRHKLR